MIGGTAIVTGAGHGIGTSIARGLLESGCNVLVADIDGAGAAAAAAALDADGVRAAATELDVRDERSFEAAFRVASETWGRVDVLVNNAARVEATSIWEIGEHEWDDVLAVNLRGTFFGCRIAGRHMREQGYGRIVNVSSLAGEWGRSLMGAHYAASKAGIIGLTRVFAFQLAADGVTVNAVAPAAIAAERPRVSAEEVRAYVEATVPVGRSGTSDEVAKAVCFLASEQSGFITGVTIDVNGGALMR